MIYENVDPEANIIFGALVDPEAQSEKSIIRTVPVPVILKYFSQ